MAATIIAEHGKWNIVINFMHRYVWKWANIVFFDPRNMFLTLVNICKGANIIFVYLGFTPKKYISRVKKSKMAATMTIIAEHGKWNMLINFMHRYVCKGANIMFLDPRNLILTLVLPKNIYFKGKKSKMATTRITEHGKWNMLINVMHR